MFNIYDVDDDGCGVGGDGGGWLW